MLEMTRKTKQQPQEGIIVSDPDGVVIAWRDGLVRRFSWDQLRKLTMSKEMSGQSAQQDIPLVQRAA
jgi:hypothetical protein